MKALFKTHPVFTCALLAILIVRIVMLWLSYTQGLATIEADSQDYLRLAVNLTELGIYGDPGQPEIFRVPGYPAILAFFTFMAGSKALILALLSQLIADTLTTFCVFSILNRFANSQVACIGAILTWGSFGLMAYSQRLLSESFFTSLFMIVLWCYIYFQKEKPILSAVVAGIGLGALCYFRALALPLAAVIGVYFFLIRDSKRGCIILLTWAICISPWIIRNATTANFVNFSSSSAITFYRYHAAALAANQNNISFEKQQHAHTQQINALKSQSEQAKMAQAETRRIIASAPLSYITLHIKKSITNLFPLSGEWLRQWGMKLGENNTLNVLNNDGIWAAAKSFTHGSTIALLILLLSCATWAAQLLFALFGWIDIYKSKRSTAILIGAVLLLFLGITGPDSHPRFRVPVLPLIAMLSALGSMRFLPSSNKNKRPCAE